MTDSQNDRDPKTVLDTVRDAIYEYRQAHFRDLHNLGDLAVFVSETDYDALHEIRDPEGEYNYRTDTHTMIADGTTTWGEHLPSEFDLEYDRQVPDGHPLVLPKTPWDFGPNHDPDDRWLSFLPRNYAEAIVEAHGEFDTASRNTNNRYYILSVTFSFETLADHRVLDSERIADEGLYGAGAGFEHDYSEGWRPDGPISEEIREVSIRARYAEPMFTDGSASSIDSATRQILVGHLTERLQAVVGSVLTYPVMATKDVWVPPDGDTEPVAVADRELESPTVPMDHQIEHKTVQAGERRVWLGRVRVPDFGPEDGERISL